MLPQTAHPTALSAPARGYGADVAQPDIRPETIRAIAAELGFDLVRFGPVEPGSHGAHLLRWLELGRHGTMRYMEENRARTLEPTAWRAGLRSAINLAIDYGAPPGELTDGARVARYAVGRDYHRWLRERVFRLRQRLEAAGAPRWSMNGGTDAVPVLERALAVRSGIGFLAKSAMVISPTHGPYLQLAELLTGLDLPADGPAPGSCGTCTACLDACPTGALVAPHEVDARVCLSYTTIELRGPIPRELRRPQGEWLFGCDVCLEVCPFTKRSAEAKRQGAERRPELQPHAIVQQWTLVDFLELDAARYDAQVTGTAMRRATRSGLRRNAAIALGNRGDDASLPALRQALLDADAVVRGAAAWAIGQIASRDPALDRAVANETDHAVRADMLATRAEQQA